MNTTMGRDRYFEDYGGTSMAAQVVHLLPDMQTRAEGTGFTRALI